MNSDVGYPQYGIDCPMCRRKDVVVLDSRWTEIKGVGVVKTRRRECGCGKRFNTYEVGEVAMAKLQSVCGQGVGGRYDGLISIKEVEKGFAEWVKKFRG
jgi:hypothetical protein